MPEAFKVLGQSNPLASTDTHVYTVPASTETIISSVIICNQAATASTCRVAIRPDGAAIAAQHYIAYDTPVPANDSLTVKLGITLDASDVITVNVPTTTFSVSVFGSEIT